MSELTDLKMPVALGTTWKETELLASRRGIFVESQWNDTEYCLHRFTPNSPSDQSSDGQMQQSSGFSLSLIGTSIASDREHLLREQIATKMSQGSLYCGSGQVTTLEPAAFPQPSQVYYCLLEAHGGQSSLTGPDTSLTSPLCVDAKRQYVVCFASLGKTGLDLHVFRTELDSFCAHLNDLLPDKPAEEVAKSFQGSPLQTLLSDWFSLRVEYITRVIQLCQKVLPELLYVAIDSEVEVQGPNECNVRDVKLFLETCSMASLMQFEGEKRVTPNAQAENKVTVTVSHNSCTVSSHESSQFCSNWAQVLLAHGTSNPDPFFLRQAVENYKLKIVQDLNAFKRLLMEAESDYHALYRCYLFLSVCGNGKLLLDCVTQEANSLQVAPTLAVLEVLQTFTQKNGFRKIT